MAQTAYYDDSEMPRLMRSYCVFADFLGFRQEIKDAVVRGDEHVVFQRFMQEIEPQIDDIINPSPEEEAGFNRNWDAKIFTDNVVLGYALWSDAGENEFGNAISQLLPLQYATALKGCFVRGGWAVGNLFMNRNTVFGGALLDAYDLEQQKAIYPRIVLSDDLKELVFQHMAFYADDPPHCHYLMIDDEGTLFINYLSEAMVDGEVIWDDLICHAKLVGERLVKYANQQHVLSKYQWLADYHNFVCSLVSGCDGYSDAVKVPGAFPSRGLRQLLHDDSPYVAAKK